jgi:hypothetical protein
VKAAGDYINNLEDKRGKPARLVPGANLPDDIEVLPDPTKLDPGSEAGVQEGVKTNFFSESGSEAGNKVFADTPSGNGASPPHPEREVFTI